MYIANLRMGYGFKIQDTWYNQSPYFGACIWPIIWDVEGNEYQVNPIYIRGLQETRQSQG